MNIMDDISMAFSYFGVVSEYPYAKFPVAPALLSLNKQHGF